MLNIDRPLIQIKDDLLRRKTMVDILAKSLIESSKQDHECLCIGIYGKWGEGKTTFMNFIEESLLSNGKDDNLNIVHFNPWIASSEESLMLDFFNTISEDQLGVIQKMLKQYGGIISLGVKGIAGLAATATGHTYLIPTISNGVDRFRLAWNECKEAFCSIDDVSLAKRKKEISKEIVKSKRHLLIFIDDLDRLDKEEIHTVFRLIRQVADFDNTTYIVAMDPDIVAKSLSNFFGDGRIIEGKNFIDKIIQIPFQLPIMDQMTLCRIMEDRLESLWKQYDCGPMNDFQKVCKTVSGFFTTIRQVVHFLNQLSFIIPVLYEEVNIPQLCYLIALKTLDNQAYLRIVSHKDDLFKTCDSLKMVKNEETEKEAVQQRYEAALDDIVKDLDLMVRYKVKSVLDKLFTEAFDYSSELDNKYINTTPYFMRYFMLDVPCDMVSDKECNQIYHQIPLITHDELVLSINSLISSYSYEEMQRVVISVIRKQKDLPRRCEITEKIIKALSCCSICEQYGYYTIYDNNLTIFIVETLLKLYMIKEMPVNKLWVNDEERISSCIEWIYRNSGLQFCLSLHYQMYNSNYYKLEGFSSQLIERFIALSYEEQLKYSKEIIWSLFSTWTQIDVDEPQRYLRTAIKSQDFNKKLFLEHLVDGDHSSIDVRKFIEIFREVSEELVVALKAQGETFETCRSMSFIASNYHAIMASFLRTADTQL